MRYFPHGLVAATTVISGLLLGSGISSLLAAELLSEPRRPRLPHVAPPHPRAVAGVMAGHLFAPAPARPPPPEPGDGVARCREGWALVGVVHDLAHPERSIAAVRAPDGAAVVGVGAAWGARTLVEVHRTEARFRTDEGESCAISMFTERTTTELSLPLERPPPEPSVAGVSRLAEDRYVIDRAAFDAAQSEAGGVVVRPAMRGGAMIGARLHRVRPGTILHAAGLRDGDVVTRADGRPLSDPAVGLEAYGRLRGGAPVRVTVERAGREMEVVYSVE